MRGLASWYQNMIPGFVKVICYVGGHKGFLYGPPWSDKRVGPPNWGHPIRQRPVVWEVTEFTQGTTEEIEAYLNTLQRNRGQDSERGTVCQEAVMAGGGGRAVVKGEGEEVWEHMQFSFFDIHVQVWVTHWSGRAYGYFDVGHLMGLFVFSQGARGTVGPPTLFRFPLFKLIA